MKRALHIIESGSVLKLCVSKRKGPKIFFFNDNILNIQWFQITQQIHCCTEVSENENLCSTSSCEQMFLAGWFVEQLRCASTGEQSYTLRCIHTMEHYSSVRRMDYWWVQHSDNKILKQGKIKLRKSPGK